KLTLVFANGKTQILTHEKKESEMKNAHRRFGWLTYVKSTEKTTTSIKLRLDRFIGDMLPVPPRQAKAHLISIIGGDTQISAISAAISLADRFMIEGSGVPAIRVWSGWFSEELNSHRALIHALGIGCDPVVIKGTKEQFLDCSELLRSFIKDSPDLQLVDPLTVLK